MVAQITLASSKRASGSGVPFARQRPKEELCERDFIGLESISHRHLHYAWRGGVDDSAEIRIAQVVHGID
jgi:hypothetical protein